MTIAAELYAISAAAKRTNPGKTKKLEITKIEDGRRELVTAFYVDDTRHARRLALAYDATPWNF